MAIRTALDLANTISKMQVMNIAELGSTSSQINSYIYTYLSLAMQKWARLAYQVKVSDVLNITTDGYQTFKVNLSDVADLYEPLRVLDSTGKEIRKRVSFSDPTAGWLLESANTQIHTKGMTGNFTLHYIKYPDWISSDTQVPEWPPAGYMALIYETCGMILESKGFIDESNNMYAIASRHMNTIVMANTSARNQGMPPSMNDVNVLRGG